MPSREGAYSAALRHFKKGTLFGVAVALHWQPVSTDASAGVVLSSCSTVTILVIRPTLGRPMSDYACRGRGTTRHAGARSPSSRLLPRQWHSACLAARSRCHTEHNGTTVSRDRNHTGLGQTHDPLPKRHSMPSISIASSGVLPWPNNRRRCLMWPPPPR